MDIVRGKGNKGVIIKTWERSSGLRRALVGKSEYNYSSSSIWPRLTSKRNRSSVAPEGCFSVYVGEEKQRFVIKTEYVNHPLFKVLLEEAESEYGYNSEGPLVLPCDVDLFVKVLAEMDGNDDEIHHQGCNTTFYRSCSSYRILDRLI